MKLVAIYNAWADGTDFLRKSIENMLPVVDGVIVVWSKDSNYGVQYKWNVHDHIPPDEKCLAIEYKQHKVMLAYLMECEKRNMGLAQARALGFTHFIVMDCDEFYFKEDVNYVRDNIGNLNGTVCKTQLYFSKPTLTIGYDTTLVPFICKLGTRTKLIPDFRGFPFAYVNGEARIDPTRRPDYTDGVDMVPVMMHHYSWVRSDYDLKINNSSARRNLLRSNIKNDLAEAAAGSYCSFYRKKLFEVPNFFNL